MEDTPIVLENKDDELIEKVEESLENNDDDSVEKVKERIENKDQQIQPLEEISKKEIISDNNAIENILETRTDDKDEFLEVHLSLENILVIIFLICFGLTLLILEAPIVLAFMFFIVAIMALGGYIVINPGKGLRLIKTGLMSSLFLNGFMIPI